ncbi:MAG TPA: MiaB/RimO family radical SAM methylthiotransferase [Bellilinea sp.]|nr:MiaB/RimO family radical SAM methylthiotransferase [Bellilinea sp.]
MNVYVDSIGCRLNQSEIEKIASQFRVAGHTIVQSAAEADLVVVNTCAVTSAAASDSRQKLRHAVRAGAETVIATGCWATLEPEAAAKLTGVSMVVPNQAKGQLVSDLLSIPQEVFDYEPLAREPLPGTHLRTRAFIKVQDGCDNHCTFCITRVARGAGASQSLEDVLMDIQHAVMGGAREVVLSGVHLGSWGQDWGGRTRLRDLIAAILNDTDVERLRLSSLEPWDLDENFFRLWENPRMCRHLHLPLQSGSAATLKRMVRNTTPPEYRQIISMARHAAEDMAITTDIIVGFPGEDDEEFAESRAFIEEMQFSGGHVFTYSVRPGTPAEKLKPRIPTAIARVRNHQVQAILKDSGDRYRQSQLGKTVSVLWESASARDASGWRIHGLTDTYIKVQTYADQPLWNELSQVRLTGSMEDGLTGEIAV